MQLDTISLAKYWGSCAKSCSKSCSKLKVFFTQRPQRADVLWDTGLNFQRSVHMNVYTSIRPSPTPEATKAPVRPKINPLKPQTSPMRSKLRSKISPLRLEISPLKPKFSPLGSQFSPQIFPFRFQICPHLCPYMSPWTPRISP